MANLLVIDDDDAFREAIAETLTSLGHVVTGAGNGRDGIRALEKGRYAAVFLDHRMPEMDGLEVLAAMRTRLPRLPPVIVLTAHASSGNTIEAMRLGAFDHLAKPIGREAVADVLARALRGGQAMSQTVASTDDADELIGISSPMREVHKRIGLAAGGDAPVLVLGETGTGKEMVARALHRHSSRASGPFVAINCAAIPKDLLESELFGHVRGAYTGALTDRPGCFRSADGGVLLLDEIGDMALAVQAKLLRVLQEREVTPLGSHKPVKVDVRVIAATHRDLIEATHAGAFREDLRYRLDVLRIELPPLRERLADILPLAERFLRTAAGHEAPKRLSAAAGQRLLQHPWPGNVRELKNLMERCSVMVRQQVIDAADLGLQQEPAAARRHADGLPAEWSELELPAAVEKLEGALIGDALARCGGNRSDAARQLGIHRQLLYRRMEQYEIKT